MKQARRLALFLLLTVISGGWIEGQTTPGVQQGGTGATTPAGARANLGAAAASHSHALTELLGVTGKSGTSGVLQTFGGGATTDGECAKFDANGNIVGNGAPCGGVSQSNYSQSFVSQSSVTLTHGLNTANVIVGCYDGADQQIEPNSVTVLNESSLIVAFAVPQTGRCVVNGTGGATVSGTGDTTVAANSGSGASILKTGTNVVAKTLKAGSNVIINSGTDEITISAVGDGAGITSINSQTGASQILSAGSFINVASTGNTHTVSVTNTQGNGARLATVDASPADGCAAWTSGTLSSTGAPCGTGSGATAAGSGIVIAGGAISADPATVPSYLTGTAALSFSAFSGLGNCEEQNLTVSGAAIGDAVAIGLPTPFPAGLVQGAAWVSTANTVTIRLCRLAGTSTITSQTFRAWVNKTF
jgi:hypothetical protein